MILTVANRHDVTQLLPLIDAIPTQIARRVSPTVVALAKSGMVQKSRIFVNSRRDESSPA
jgi:hypothetical protein